MKGRSDEFIIQRRVFKRDFMTAAAADDFRYQNVKTQSPNFSFRDSMS